MMAAFLLISILITSLTPEPVLLKSTIELARIAGLPRLKVLDVHIRKKIFLNEIDKTEIYVSHTRLEFLTSYFKLNALRNY